MQAELAAFDLIRRTLLIQHVIDISVADLSLHHAPSCDTAQGSRASLCECYSRGGMAALHSNRATHYHAGW